jgi:hypothetical protein
MVAEMDYARTSRRGCRWPKRRGADHGGSEAVSNAMVEGETAGQQAGAVSFGYRSPHAYAGPVTRCSIPATALGWRPEVEPQPADGDGATFYPEISVDLSGCNLCLQDVEGLLVAVGGPADRRGRKRLGKSRSRLAQRRSPRCRPQMGFGQS